MPRGRRNVVSEPIVEEVELVEPELEDVDVPDVEEEVEDVTTETVEAKEEKPKEPAKPKRGELGLADDDDQYITPVQFAKILSTPIVEPDAENGVEGEFHYTARNGSHEVAPQMVYSYLKSSATGKNPLQTYEVEDSNGVTRKVLKQNEALAWWAAKNERAVERAKGAAEKATKQAAKAAESPSSTDDAVAETAVEVEEAE